MIYTLNLTRPNKGNLFIRSRPRGQRGKDCVRWGSDSFKYLLHGSLHSLHLPGPETTRCEYRLGIYRQTSIISAPIKVLITQMLLEHRLSVLLQPHLHSRLNIWLQWIGQRQLQDETRNLYVLGFGAPFIRYLTVNCCLSWWAHNHTARTFTGICMQRTQI